jgi:PilZ domain-containing protein
MITMTEQVISIERRKVERLRTFKLGRIVFNGSSSGIDCVIRDLSEAGAQLGIPAYAHLPDRFRLHMLSDGTMVPARFAWRRGDRLGVSFDGEITRAPPAVAGSSNPATVLQSA